MRKEIKKAPTIRFRGFTDDWEQHKVSDIAGRYDNLRVPVSSNKRVHGTTPYYGANGVQDYVDGYTHDGEYILIAEDGANDLQNYPVHYVNGRIWVNNHAHVLQGKTGIADTKFLSYAFSQIDISSLLVGGGRAKLNADVLMKLDLLLPEHKEQEKLGNYFSHIDSLIPLHQRKLDQLKKLKKYFLQNMFPAKGEKVPRIRLKGYTDEWKECKLKDIYGNIGNAFVGTATPYYTSNGHFYLESNNVKDGQINREIEVFINDEFYEKQKDKWLHTGDIVMVQSGHVGHTAVIPSELDKTAAHALIMFRQPKIKVDPYFLNYQFQTDKSKKSFNSITVGNTIEHILASSMKEYIVDMPSYIEQQSISHYFKEIDCLINFQQRKLGELQSLKKYMLQNMFI